MLRTSESETEILLGNKQLIGIFFVIALLLGIAFYSGYMVGHSSPDRRVSAAPAQAANPPVSQQPAAAGGETHSFPADSGQTEPNPRAHLSASGTAREGKRDNGGQTEPPPLGSPKKRAPSSSLPDQANTKDENSADAFSPQNGDEFLQVAAVGRDEAEAVADVLHKKGFRAHAVPKPGNSKIFRVLIGPIKDSGDLSSTRDALRRTGFRNVILQRY